MLHQEFQENWRIFSELIDKLHCMENEHIKIVINHYIEQNVILLNDIFSDSINSLKRLQRAMTSNDIICAQARFTNEIRKKLSLANQRFLNTSLEQISDYDAWLNAHCDLATD